MWNFLVEIRGNRHTHFEFDRIDDNLEFVKKIRFVTLIPLIRLVQSIGNTIFETPIPTFYSLESIIMWNFVAEINVLGLIPLIRLM